MKAPTTIKLIVLKYHSLSDLDKLKFGDEPVVPASDLFNSLVIVEHSLRICTDMAKQSSLLLKFLIDNESRFESHDFRVLIDTVRLSLDSLSNDANLLGVQYNDLVNFQ